MSLSMSIKKDFGSFQLDMSLEAGNETLALLGASGSGKSMTLKCIAGIVTPDEGYIQLDGEALFDSRAHINLPPQKRRVGLLFQNYALFPNMTVTQNILSGMNFEGSAAEKQALCAKVIDRFYLNGLEKHRPAQLSGGQQQRVALARILASRPRILMLDEPFSALDSFLRWELEKELMRVLGDFRGTSLLVSHDRDEVYRISRNIAVIKGGHVDALGEKSALFRYPPSYESALLTGCRNFSRAEYADDHHLRALDWDVTLRAARLVPQNLRYIGVRPHFMHPAAGETENILHCRVHRSIDNLTDRILLLGTPGGDSGHSELYLRLSHASWKPLEGREELDMYLPPEAVLLMDH